MRYGLKGTVYSRVAQHDAFCFTRPHFLASPPPRIGRKILHSEALSTPWSKIMAWNDHAVLSTESPVHFLL
jgi:hypothetical protein